MHHGTSAVDSLAISSDGRFIASLGFDKTLKLWETATGHFIQTVPTHSDDFLYGVSCSPTENMLAVGTQDALVKLITLHQEGAIYRPAIRTLHGHTSKVEATAFHPRLPIVASASWDTTIRLWCTITSACTTVLTGHGDCIRSIAFSHNGNVLASGDTNRTVKVWKDPLPDLFAAQ